MTGLVVWVVMVLVRAVVAAFSTPYPWIVLAVVGVGAAAYKLSQRVARERAEARFWTAVAAVGDRSPDATTAVGAMVAGAHPDADVLLLAAADAAASGRDGAALHAIDEVRHRASAVGALSGGLHLRFPGLVGVALFVPGPTVPALLEIVRAHLLIRLGRAGEALALPLPPFGEPVYALRLSVLGDARMVVGDFAAAAQAFREAVTHASGTTERTELKYRLARAMESAGDLAEAANEFRSLGEYADASARAESLFRAHALAMERAEQERRLAVARSEQERRLATARAEEQRRVALARAEQERQRAIDQAEEEALRGAMEKLRAARGPAGRRADVERGLDAIRDPSRREQLLVEASRLEVLAVLEKVDGLKTAAAKRRHLAAALEAIRNDDVRDELQVQQIRALECALVEVDA